MEMPAILKAGSNIIFRISENHDGIISQSLRPFEGRKLQLFPVAFALGIRMNAQRTECQYILFVPVGINQLTPGVHDIADDFPVFFQNKVKFRYKIGVLPQSMRQIVFTAARNVDVPKRFLRQLLHCAEVPFFFISNPHIARPRGRTKNVRQEVTSPVCPPGPGTGLLRPRIPAGCPRARRRPAG